MISQDYDYLLAKLHGMHSKSIINKKFDSLKKNYNIEKIYKELFETDESQHIKENRLYSIIESKYKIKIFKEINFIARYFDYKNSLINNLILRYEIDNVKFLIKSYYEKRKSISGLFEVDMKNTLNYRKIYSLDISQLSNIKNILKNTMFDFLINFIESKNDIFIIENKIDIFYYKRLLESLEDYSSYEIKILLKIILEEINWQNIIWALRLKLHYSINFNEVKDSFMKFNGLIPTGDIQLFFKLNFIAGEAKKYFSNFPSQYRDILINAFRDDGSIDLNEFEINVLERLNRIYSRYFFCENFNILPVISFIYIKRNEYFNVVKLIESIRYNINLI